MYWPGYKIRRTLKDSGGIGMFVCLCLMSVHTKAGSEAGAKAMELNEWERIQFSYAFLALQAATGFLLETIVTAWSFVLHHPMNVYIFQVSASGAIEFIAISAAAAVVVLQTEHETEKFRLRHSGIKHIEVGWLDLLFRSSFAFTWPSNLPCRFRLHLTATHKKGCLTVWYIFQMERLFWKCGQPDKSVKCMKEHAPHVPILVVEEIYYYLYPKCMHIFLGLFVDWKLEKRSNESRLIVVNMPL